MENNNQFDEVLVRYLFNEETDEEKVFVETWVNASEENRHYFNRLKKAWQLTEVNHVLDSLLNEVNLEEKWNRFEQNVTKEGTQIFSINEKETFEVKRLEEERPNRKEVVYRLLRFVAVAASVIFVIGLGWKFFSTNKMETPVAMNTEKRTDQVLVVRHEVNATGKEKRIQISDGSLIVLADKSEITYQEPFTNRRDITLLGKAYFKVAKDKSRPFTVISGDISTTALGTEFTVTAFKSENRIVVRLYEGKVVVKPLQKKNSKLKNDVYLLPGQQFIYSNETTTKVKTFKVDEDESPEEVLNHEIERDNPYVPQNAPGSWYMFNNQSVEQVLDQLGDLYEVRIIYDKKDVENIYFTGKYNRSVSVELILNQIGTLNNLTVTRKDNTFIISK